ncbi:MAG: LpqB family beta-propeller domain-containing protein [Aeromicrobium sp.]
MKQNLVRNGLIVVASVLALASCARIPDSGPVSKVGVDRGTDENTVRYSPAGPANDASPQQIVRGYLDAMLAYPVSTGTASAFLTPEAARDWKSSAGVEVYEAPDVSTPVIRDNGGGVERPSARVSLNLVEDAKLDRQGRFSRVNARKNFTFRLVSTGGQWRIDNPQPGFLVNQKFFDDYYRPFNDYFFDRSGKRLVAMPIYVPVGDQLSTALISSLLVGPGNLINSSARTYLPKDAQLRTSVPLRNDGLAEVQFRGDLTSLPTSAQARLSAQITWTLRQVDRVSGVRIIGGDNVLYPGDRGVQSVDSWQTFGPRFGDGGFYGLQKNRIVKLSGRAVDPVEGPWGSNARGAVSLAVDSGNVAVVGKGRTSLLIGSFAKKNVATINGHNLLSPLWDDSDGVWAVDTSGGDTRVRIVKGKAVRQLAIGRLAAFDVRSFALSPDGSRYSLIAEVGTGSQVYAGSVLRDSSDSVVSLGAPTHLQGNGSTFTKPRSMSWANDTTVTFLADDDVVGTQIFQARIDGSMVSGGTASSGPLLPNIDAVSFATTGGDRPVRYVTDKKLETWLLRSGGAWERINPRAITAIIASTSSPSG